MEPVGKKRATRIGAAQHVPAIIKRLVREFAEVKAPLEHRNAFELLVATVLSAQCTDAQVNLVTPRLFARYPDPESMAGAPIHEIEQIIKPLGLFHSKARALQSAARQLTQEFGGRVPTTIAELTRLRGVGRKTANVVLGHAFGIPGVVVDTHVKRVAGRLGLSKHAEPENIERDLMRLLPQKEWSSFSHRLILHGRKTCKARGPKCQDCCLYDLCGWEGKDAYAKGQTL
jgi:endonuclease-3